MVTILDVAREAQVAPSTVSLVVNRNGYVSTDTRRRVESTIKRMGYKARRPRPQARRLNLAVVYTPSPPAMDIAPIALSIIDGIHAAMDRHRVRSSLIAAVMDPPDPVFQQAIAHQRFDGAIVVGASHEGDLYARMLAACDVPTVMVNRVLPGLPVSSVAADFHQGGYRATAELARRGHRRIGFVALDDTHWPSAQRRQGHHQALADFNLEPGLELLLPMASMRQRSAPGLTDYCQQVIAQGHTALAVAPHRGQEIAHCLAGMGLSIPRDVSMVGFDAPAPLASPHHGPMASIDYDKRDLGLLAVETLKELVEGRARLSRMTKILHTRYVDGPSVANPAGSAKD